MCRKGALVYKKAQVNIVASWFPAINFQKDSALSYLTIYGYKRLCNRGTEFGVQPQQSKPREVQERKKKKVIKITFSSELHYSPKSVM